ACKEVVGARASSRARSGILGRFRGKRGVDVPLLETAVLQEARLPRALLEVARQLGAEALAAHGGRLGGPVDVGARERRARVGLVYAALGELGTDSDGALASRRARADEACREALVGERAFALELRQRGGDDRFVVAAAQEL